MARLFASSFLLLLATTSTATAQQLRKAAAAAAAPAPAPKAAGPESLYKQQRVEYTFPVPVSLAALQQDGTKVR